MIPSSLFEAHPEHNFNSPSDRQSSIHIATEQPSEGSKPATQRSLLQLVNFYLGVTLSMCGVGAFLAAAVSRKWVEASEGDNILKVEGTGPGYRLGVLAHMGPWVACNQGKRCGKPWHVAPGLDEKSVKGVQAMLLITILTYLCGAAVIVLQLVRPRWLLSVNICKCVLDNAFTEGILPIAAVMGVLFVLMIGELKRKLILQADQTLRPGWAFVVCLVSLLSTVAGSICMIFNRPRNGGQTIFSLSCASNSARSKMPENHARRDFRFPSAALHGPDIHATGNDVGGNEEGTGTCHGIEAGRGSSDGKTSRNAAYSIDPHGEVAESGVGYDGNTGIKDSVTV